MPPSKQKEAVTTSRVTRSSKLPEHEFLFLEDNPRRKTTRSKPGTSASASTGPGTSRQTQRNKKRTTENGNSVSRLTTNALESTFQQLQLLRQQLNDCKQDNNILLERVNLLQNTVVDLYNERSENQDNQYIDD